MEKGVKGIQPLDQRISLVMYHHAKQSSIDAIGKATCVNSVNPVPTLPVLATFGLRTLVKQAGLLLARSLPDQPMGSFHLLLTQLLLVDESK